MIFDQHNEDFHELTGGGLPMAVSEAAAYQKFQRNIVPGQIILIGTDGIWESQNQSGEMFGKDRFKEVIRQHANEGAKKILDAVMKAIENFSQEQERVDDITLVVVKITK
jgi:sigma-B regulation protein RsbU (phosphoserine phosphatase)